MKIYAKIQAMLSQDTGATAVEYALLVSLIAVAIIIAVRALGLSVSGIFDNVRSAVGG
jgi:pilus assembly protein Flp/PilA